MKDKTVLITGANAGIGLTTSVGLAKLGARVLMVSRDEGRGRKAHQLVKEKSGNGTMCICSLLICLTRTR